MSVVSPTLKSIRLHKQSRFAYTLALIASDDFDSKRRKDSIEIRLRTPTTRWSDTEKKTEWFGWIQGKNTSDLRAEWEKTAPRYTALCQLKGRAMNTRVRGVKFVGRLNEIEETLSAIFSRTLKSQKSHLLQWKFKNNSLVLWKDTTLAHWK